MAETSTGRAMCTEETTRIAQLEAVLDHYRAGLEHIAKTWANGNGAGPAAKQVLETAPDADEENNDG